MVFNDIPLWIFLYQNWISLTNTCSEKKFKKELNLCLAKKKKKKILKRYNSFEKTRKLKT